MIEKTYLFILFVIVLAIYTVSIFLLGKAYGHDDLKEKYDLIPKPKCKPTNKK